MKDMKEEFRSYPNGAQKGVGEEGMRCNEMQRVCPTCQTPSLKGFISSEVGEGENTTGALLEKYP